MAPQDSQDLTRVGPGTVMGNFMRQYWIPAARSGELEADALLSKPFDVDALLVQVNFLLSRGRGDGDEA